MTQPTDKHRETATALAQISIPKHEDSHEADYGPYCMNCDEQEEARFGEMIDAIATALTNLEAEAYARGRGEAKAEDAEMADRYIQNYLEVMSKALDRPMPEWTGSALAKEILASSPGPSLEVRIRAEIAERVQALPVADDGLGEVGDGKLVRRDDVLAAIAAPDSSPQKAVIDPPDVVPPDLTTGLDDIFDAAIRKEEGR